MITTHNKLSFKSFRVNTVNKNILRSERNNILRGIIACEVGVKSIQIAFTNFDKSSLRKRTFTEDYSKLNELSMNMSTLT
jgi:hypothetical protein